MRLRARPTHLWARCEYWRLHLVAHARSTDASGKAVGSLADNKAVVDLVLTCSLCNESSVQFSGGKYSKIGEATETALVVLVEKLDVFGDAKKPMNDEDRATACNTAIRSRYSRAQGKVSCVWGIIASVVLLCLWYNCLCGIISASNLIAAMLSVPGLLSGIRPRPQVHECVRHGARQHRPHVLQGASRYCVYALVSRFV